MKEIQFISENRKRWQEYENILRTDRSVSPDKLSDMYTELTSDCSYAKTFYPKSKAVLYLESLAIKVHRKVYRNSKEKRGRVKTFFLDEIPKAIRQSQNAFRLSLVTFLLAILIGLFSSSQDDRFVRLILGDSYVNMTMENIENEDPLAVYKDARAADMFTMIAINNVRVSFLAFVAGIIGSFGTLFILFSNGVMVGAFLYFFIEKGLAQIALTTIFIHGALELSAIVIAGAAGLVLGNSLLFPKTYRRMVSLRLGAVRAVKIIIGLVPVFIVAAFIESFMTRWYIELGLPGRLSIIILSFAYIYWYFIYLPKKKYPDVPDFDYGAL